METKMRIPKWTKLSSRCYELVSAKQNNDEERSRLGMRKKQQDQMPLMMTQIDHPRADELKRIGQILDENPTISQLVWQDLTRRVQSHGSGAHGLSADQVLRAVAIKQAEGFSYEDLAFHILDSRCYRTFCRIGITQGIGKSALASAIKSITPATWESINRILDTYARSKGIEKGKEARIDCTVVCSNIHEPTDSTLLWDAVRVITRILTQVRGEIDFTFSDHTRKAKRTMLAIRNGRGMEIRKGLYKELLKITRKVAGYAVKAIHLLQEATSPYLISLCEDLKRVLLMTHRVIDQTSRRVLDGEEVPAEKKVVSLFEPHTDIIKKDQRETFYGHKVCLSVGRSNLITDCVVLHGNPADSTLMEDMLKRHDQIYGHYPLKVALDGGFTSKHNLDFAKSKKVQDVCFAKKRGLSVLEMCRSEYVYKKLRRFRAGIESAISWLKRCLGLDRCTWKSFSSFHSYVWASIVSANLITIARGQRA
jgi:IS5 family transposase